MEAERNHRHLHHGEKSLKALSAPEALAALAANLLGRRDLDVTLDLELEVRGVTAKISTGDGPSRAITVETREPLRLARAAGCFYKSGRRRAKVVSTMMAQAGYTVTVTARGKPVAVIGHLARPGLVSRLFGYRHVGFSGPPGIFRFLAG